MKIKKELLDQRMSIFGKIRTLRYIDKDMYPLLFKHYPFLFEENKNKSK